ncbi:MAG: hypothetical protein ACRD2N_23340 [Vicinamibacterales bacterium]
MKTLKAPAVRVVPAVVLVSVTAWMACGGRSTASNPMSPSSSSTSSSGTICRTYPTSADVTTTTLGATQGLRLTGAFNTSTNQSTVTTLFANGTPCTTTVGTYRSTADFVDEVRVVPSVTLQTASTTTNTGTCGSGTSNVTFTYDSQRRLTAFTSTGAGIVAGTTTYTAWDSSGRPTTGSFPGTTITNVYNDAARTLTQTQTPATGGATSVTAVTFDANGIQLMVVNTTGAAVSTTRFTITSTERVCR